jgi:hypothetical protein
MANIKFYAPNGVSDATLADGRKITVASGYATADSKYAPELMRSGWTPAMEDGVTATTNADGSVSLAVPGVAVSPTKIAKGYLYVQPNGVLTIPNNVATQMPHDTVWADTLGAYNSTTHVIDIPDNIETIDVEWSIEIANIASGFGGSGTGTKRSYTMNVGTSGGGSSAVIGLAAIVCNGIGLNGGTFGRFAKDVSIPLADYPTGGRSLLPKFNQDSGGNLVVGSSSGSGTGPGTGQMYIKVWFY